MVFDNFPLLLPCYSVVTHTQTRYVLCYVRRRASQNAFQPEHWNEEDEGLPNYLRCLITLHGLPTAIV